MLINKGALEEANRKKVDRSKATNMTLDQYKTLSEEETNTQKNRKKQKTKMIWKTIQAKYF